MQGQSLYQSLSNLSKAIPTQKQQPKPKFKYKNTSFPVRPKKYIVIMFGVHSSRKLAAVYIEANETLQ